MTPHKQLHKHDPENGVQGDCWRTCIACLLDLNPISVPHFTAIAEDTDQDWKRLTREWLRPRSLSIFTMPIVVPADATLEKVLDTIGEFNPDIPFILGGRAVGTKVLHCVIVRDGEILHDPSGSGIEGPDENGFYWIEFLVPLPK